MTCGELNSCERCWDREIPGTKTTIDKKSECELKDSGDRRQFESGAVRDMGANKGRCDLLPLGVVAELTMGGTRDKIIGDIYAFQITGNPAYLHNAINVVVEREIFEDIPTLFLEVAKHFEAGCIKYGENNWQKGIPVKVYIDSAVRHYLKYLRGDADEPHDRAFCWNILCAIWTCINKPELNDYERKKEE